MVVGAFPIAKLGALLIRQVSKPIANVIKERAKTHPFFRKYFCMPPAQFYNWCEVQAKMWILNLGKPVSVPVLNEAMAIELGANLVGEGLIFVIAAAIVLSEYNRSSRKEAAKEEEKMKEMDTLQYKIQELYFQTEAQAAQIRELTRTISSLETRAVTKPWSKPPDVPRDVQPLPVNPDEKRPPPPSCPPLKSQGPSPTPSSKNDPESTSHIVYNPDQMTLASRSRILDAVLAVEREFWCHPPQPRRDGVLTQALDYIHREVYRFPITLS